MAKTKTLTFDDFLTKVSHVFNRDMYILDYCVGLPGPDTDEELQSSIMIKLVPEVISMIKETYPDATEISISNTKKCKSDYNTYLTTKVSSMVVSEYRNKLKEIDAIYQGISLWNQLTISESEADNLFVKGGTYTMFENGPYPKVYLSADVLPMATIKNYNEIRYAVITPKNKNDVYTLVTVLDTELFQIINIIRYISLD